MSFSEYIESQKSVLTDFLHTTLDNKIADAESEQFLKDSYLKIKHFSVTGKMIRGILVMLSYEIFNDKVNPSIYYAAAGIELTHSSFLIHDDIIDNDSTRRGEKTIFAQYEDEGAEEHVENPRFYGQSMGILHGDISFLLAFELLSQSSDNPKILHKLLPFYTREIQRVNGAQMLDFHFGADNEEPSPDQILEMNRCKSARYTFALPLVTGAILAETDDEVIQTLDSIGEKLGLVFQLKDDEIELYSTQEEIGKPVGSDVRENKKTYLRALLFSKATNKEKKKLNLIYGNPNITHDDIEYVKNCIDRHEINKQISALLGKLTNEAKDLLQNLDNVNSEKKKILEELIGFNYSRTS